MPDKIKMEEKMAQGFLLKYAEIGVKGKNTRPMDAQVSA